MSLNQIIDPVKPLNVIFGNITADNLVGSETTTLTDAGGSIVNGDNVASSTLTTANVFVEKLGDVVEGANRYEQKRYYALQGSVLTPAVIVVGKEGTFEFTLNDPSITTEWFNNRKNLVGAIGEVSFGGSSFSGSLYINVANIVNGSLTIQFISQYGALVPNTYYACSFDLTFYY